MEISTAVLGLLVGGYIIYLLIERHRDARWREYLGLLKRQRDDARLRAALSREK